MMARLEIVSEIYHQQQLQQLEALAWQQLQQTVKAIETIRSRLHPHLSPAQQRKLDRHVDLAIGRLVREYYQLLSQIEQQGDWRWGYEQVPDASKWN
jgi:hypothetical protein